MWKKRGLLFLLFLAIFIFNTNSIYAENITLQPGVEGNDTYIREDLPDNNFGTSTQLNFGLTGSGDRMRALFQFNLSFIPPGSTITHAEFQAYLSLSQQAITWLVNISRITQDWAEAEATWNDRLLSTTWTNAGSTYSSIVENSTSVSDSLGWKNWTITDLVQSWVNGTYTNYGFVLIGQESTSNDFKTIYSSDYTDDASLRPKLVINYTSNTLPTITSVIDNSNETNPTPVDLDVIFTVDWNDIDSGQAAIFICNSTNMLSNSTGGCADTTFCSTSNATTDPVSCQYTTQESDTSLVLYYALVCDNEGNCSSVSSAYNFSVNHFPNVTITAPNGGETINQTKDGNYEIQFSINDTDNNTLTADIYYSTVSGAKTNLIVADLNLTTNCTDSDASTITTNTCTYSWNTTGIFATFYLDIEVNDTFNITLDSSDNTFDIVSLIDTLSPNVTNENITTNLTSGEIAVVTANVTDLNLEIVWFETTNPNSVKTNYTMQLKSGDIYNGTFEVGVTGEWSFQIFANDTIGNLGNSSLINFNVSKPNATPQNELYQSSALTNELISIRAELSAADILKEISAYLNDSNYFTFLSGYPKNASIGNISNGSVETALWLIMAPSSTGTYNLTVIWTDKYSNSYNSSQINITVVSSMGNPVTVSADAGGAYFQGNNLLLRARLEDQSGNGITGATVTTTIYFPNGTIWLNSSSMTEESGGDYNFTNSLTNAPLGVYNTKVTGTSGGSSSTAKTSFNVLEKTSANITLVKINSYPETETASQYIADILVKDENGNFINSSSVRIELYDSLGNLVVGPVDYTSQTSTGRYRYNYTTPSTPTGQWETIVNVTRDGVFYFDRQYWKLVGGLFDVETPVITDNTVSSIQATVDALNTGNVEQDLTLGWTLTRTDTDATLVAASVTVRVSAGQTLTRTIDMTTSYVGEVKLKVLGTYSGTQQAGSSIIFSTVEAGAVAPSAPSGGGGGGGGGGIVRRVVDRSKLDIIDPKKTINVTVNIPKLITLVIKNTGNITLNNLNLNLEGLPSGWYKVEPKVIPTLKVNEVETFTIKIKVPITDIEQLEFSYIADSEEITIKEPAILNIKTVIEKSLLDKLREDYLKELDSLQEKVENLKYTSSKSLELDIDLSEISILVKLADEKIKETIKQVKDYKFDNVDENIGKIKIYISEAEDKLRQLGIAIIEKPPSPLIMYWAWIITWVLIIVLIAMLYLFYKRLSFYQIFMQVKKEGKKDKKEKTKTKGKEFHKRIKELEEKIKRREQEGVRGLVGNCRRLLSKGYEALDKDNLGDADKIYLLIFNTYSKLSQKSRVDIFEEIKSFYRLLLKRHQLSKYREERKNK